MQEKEEAAECKWLADLKEKEDREKEREDEVNELALQAAGIPSASDGDTEADPADPKTATMTELRRRRSIAKGKKRAGNRWSLKNASSGLIAWWMTVERRVGVHWQGRRALNGFED